MSGFAKIVADDAPDRVDLAEYFHVDRPIARITHVSVNVRTILHVFSFDCRCDAQHVEGIVFVQIEVQRTA